jgi:hypothetical protein
MDDENMLDDGSTDAQIAIFMDGEDFDASVISVSFDPNSGVLFCCKRRKPYLSQPRRKVSLLEVLRVSDREYNTSALSLIWELEYAKGGNVHLAGSVGDGAPTSYRPLLVLNGEYRGLSAGTLVAFDGKEIPPGGPFTSLATSDSLVSYLSTLPADKPVPCGGFTAGRCTLTMLDRPRQFPSEGATVILATRPAFQDRGARQAFLDGLWSLSAVEFAERFPALHDPCWVNCPDMASQMRDWIDALITFAFHGRVAGDLRSGIARKLSVVAAAGYVADEDNANSIWAKMVLDSEPDDGFRQTLARMLHIKPRC